MHITISLIPSNLLHPSSFIHHILYPTHRFIPIEPFVLISIITRGSTQYQSLYVAILHSSYTLSSARSPCHLSHSPIYMAHMTFSSIDQNEWRQCGSFWWGLHCRTHRWRRRPFHAFLDVGLVRISTGNRVFDTLKGALNGSLDIPHNDERFLRPSKEKTCKALDPQIPMRVYPHSPIKNTTSTSRESHALLSSTWPTLSFMASMYMNVSKEATPMLKTPSTITDGGWWMQTKKQWPGVSSLRGQHVYPQWKLQNLVRVAPSLGSKQSSMGQIIWYWRRMTLLVFSR